MMQIIATYWYVWLLLVVAGYGYALFNQLRRMKGMMKEDDDDFLKGAGKMFVSGAIGFSAMVLLFISIVLHVTG